MKKLTVSIAFILQLLICTNAASAASVASYSFAVVPYYSPEKIWTLFTPFVEYLSKSTGDTWKLQLYHNHEEFIQDICNGKVTVAFAGPIPLARAYEACGARPFLVALAKNGRPVYRSVLLTNNPDLRAVSDLKGKTVGFFKGSTAAHSAPLKMLKDAGVARNVTPVFLESQDRLIAALLTGDIDAAGVKESLYQRFDREKLRVLATSGPLPNFALCALPTMPQKVRGRMVSSLLTLKPLTNTRDRDLVSRWDDELKNGFTSPAKDFLPTVLSTRDAYKDATDALR